MLNELFILTKIKEGDIKAFEEIFRRYYSPLCWYATGIGRDGSCRGNCGRIVLRVLEGPGTFADIPVSKKLFI